MKKTILIFIASFLWALPPEWDFNPADYEHIMSVVAVVFNQEVSSGDILAAFNEQNECVGVSATTTISFGPHAGQEAFLIQIYSNSFSGGETISFKFYDQESGTVYFILGTIDFIQDGIVGNLVSPLELYLSYNNIPPVSGDGVYMLDEDTTATLTLGGAYDEDGDMLSYVIVGVPSHGTTHLSGNIATYIPDVNFSGTDSFQFKANDGQADSNIATMILIVNAVNDAPYLYAIDNTSIPEGETFTYNLQAEDADGDALIYTATISGGNAIVNVDGSVLIVVPQESNVTLNISVTVSDGNAAHSISFLLTVLEQQNTCVDNNNDGWCDHFPTITLNEGAVLLFEKEEGTEYTDPGAQCHDIEDGDISHLVEVSGQIVIMAVPNIYEITYDCADSDENQAQKATRTVVVFDISIADENGDGFDDDSFVAGAQGGDTNQDGTLNIIDIVIFIDIILNGEE